MRALHGLIAGAVALFVPVVHADQYQTTLPCAPIPGLAAVAHTAPRIVFSCLESSGLVGHIVDLRTGKLLLTTRYEELQGPPNGYSFSADGDSLVVVTADGKAALYPVGAKPQTWSLGGPGAVSFVAGSRTLASGTGIWDVSGEPRSLGTLRTEFGGIVSAALAPGGRVIAFAGEDTTIRFHDAATLKSLREISRLTTPSAIAFSKDGRRLFVGGGMAERVTSYDTASGVELQSWKIKGFPIDVLALLDGRSIAVVTTTFAAAPGADMALDGQILDLETCAAWPLSPGRRVDSLAIIGGKTWCFRIEGDKVEAWTL